ncbi:MAG: HAD-IIA family hydrolase [Candidatus Promineifilaceae bacterium]|nr:HAD-IIA family hydrolase [Candidatus Promineifilaceae bacterium]
MDGVLWQGETPMPGLVDFFETIRANDIGFVLATNNARKTAVQYTEKLQRMGVTIPAHQILTSAELSASILSEMYPHGTAAYVIGDKGLHDAMRAKGFAIIQPDDVKSGTGAALVIAGFTPYTDYKELAMGALLVNRGAAFYGTNPDPTFPSELGPLPGAGALFAFITAATGVTPTTFGKPEPYVFEDAIKRLESSKENTAMVGDRLTTDIAGAKSAGLHTIMLLSGISTLDDVDQSDVKPDFIFSDLRALTRELNGRV